MNRRKTLFVLWILLVPVSSVAQTLKEFSNDTLVFPDQFREYMLRYLKEDEALVVKDFLDFWSAPERDHTYRSDVNSILNALLAKKGRPKPHFLRLLQVMQAFRSGVQGEENRKAWEAGLMAALRNPGEQLRNIERLLDHSYLLLTDNIIYQSSSVVWKTSNDRFRIVSEDENLQYHFNETDLICIAQRDSEMIYSTRGVYDAFTLNWHGSQGLVSWERAGFGKEQVYAELADYIIDMSKAEYSADSVRFYHREYFNEPLLGILNEKIRRIISPDRATHPQFDSYTRRMFIKNLYESVDFDGGLSMQGARLNGTGDSNDPARIYVYRSDTLVLIGRSEYFVFRKDRVTGSKTETTVYIGNDSIFHPEIYFTFGVEKRELSLLRTEALMTRSPYFNSLHRIDMSIEQLNWKIDEPRIRLTMAPGSSAGRALFQSENYFKENHYRRLQGIDDVHPLASIRRFSEWYYSGTFPAADFAAWMKKTAEDIRQTIINLATEGFVYYDPETDEVTIKEKLHNYLNANMGLIDYDVISIRSEVNAPGENAVLDLKTNDLLINGTGTIFLSDSQNVALYPSDQKIILKENRSFLFSGRVEAGLFSFHGKHFFFDYDSFRIEMPAIDSITLRIIETTDAYGQNRVMEVKNKIEEASGQLVIDRSNNKSGLVFDPRYPWFSTSDTSYVYYQGKIPGDTSGVKEKGLRFEVEPFAIYSLDRFTKNDISFKGDFESQGILPTFAQTLHLQTDYSMGFGHEVPENGYPVYNGKGVFYNKVEMSNEGLRGSGKLTHLTSTTLSDKFLFFADSMITHASSFAVEEKVAGAEFPSVRSAGTDIRWYPEKDSYQVSAKTTPFELFGGKASLQGNIGLRPEGMTGTGQIEVDQARLTAGEYRFRSKHLQSDSVKLELFSPDGQKNIFTAENTRASINVNQQTGTFQPNEGPSLIRFPENRYISYTDQFDWDMNKKEILLTDKGSRMKETAGLQVMPAEIKEVARYISTHPRQDSLSFHSGSVRFDTRENILYAEDVKRLDVADAVIVPGENKLTIESNAHIRTLRNAVVNVFSGEIQHRIYDASIDVLSRKEYFGNGKYDYIDKNGLAHDILMDDITVDKDHQTLARGTVSEDNPLMINPYFEFAGKVALEVKNRQLFFNGGAKPLFNCPGLPNNFIAFSSLIDPGNVMIPVTAEPRALNNVRIFTGHYITNDSIHVYPAFFSSRKNYSDILVAGASGFLWYDEPSGQYRLGSEERKADPSLSENYLSFDRNFCKLFTEGKIDLGVDMGQVKLTTCGNATTNTETGETEMNVLLGLNFFFSDAAFTSMSGEIKAIPTLQAMDMRSESLRKRLSLLLGRDQTTRILEELSMFGTYSNLPQEMSFSLLFNEVKLKWNPATNSYRSSGKIGIGIIQNTPVNIMVDGFIEIQKKRSGDMIDIYLEIDPDTYYYFGYTRGVMQSISSNTEFRNTLTSLNVNQRTMDTRGRGTPYIYMIAVDRKLEMFLRRIRENLVSDEEDLLKP